MTERERLISIIESARLEALDTISSMNNGFAAWYADKLLEAGMIVPPVRIGQTVFVADKRTGAALKNIVTSIIVDGNGSYARRIYLKYSRSGFESRRMYKWAHIGKIVFLTREEAEKALGDHTGKVGE